MSKRMVNTVGQEWKECRGKVSGISSERSRPGSASTTYGTAFTTRIAVASMAPAPLPMCRDAGLRRVVQGGRDPAVEVRLALEHDPVRQVGLPDGPVGARRGGQGG